MSPIHIKDVSKIFVKALSLRKISKQTYHLGGDNINWKEILRIISIASNKESKMFIPAPAIFIKIAASIFGNLLPVSREQLTMIMEGNVCNSEEVFGIFGIDKPITFSPKNLDYLS